MRDRIRTNLIRITCDRQRLENTLRAYGDGVGTVTQYVTEDHILQALLIILLGDVEGHIFRRTQLVSVLLVLLQLLVAETTGVRTSGIHLISLFLRQIHDGERGVQTSTECYYYFLLHYTYYIYVILFRYSYSLNV